MFPEPENCELCGCVCLQVSEIWIDYEDDGEIYHWVCNDCEQDLQEKAAEFDFDPQ